MADTTYEPPVVPQKPGKSVAVETDEAEQQSGNSSSSPWNALDLLSQAAKVMKPSGETAGPVEQAGRVAEPAGQLDFSPGRRIADNPMVEKTIRKIKDSSDPVLEVVNMIAGGLDNVRSASAYKAAGGGFGLMMSRDHATCDKMVNKSIGAFSAGPTTMDTDVSLRALLYPDGRGGTAMQLTDFNGVHPSVDGPNKRRAAMAESLTLFHGNDGEFHVTAIGKAEWGLFRQRWTRGRAVTVGSENMNDPAMREALQNGDVLNQALADLLKIQQSPDFRDIGIRRAHAAVPGTEQFDLSLRTWNAQHVPINQELNTGIPAKVKSVDLATDVSASLTFSREAGVALNNIRGVKINLETFGGAMKQVVSPTKLTFSRDATGKAAVGVEFVMHDSEGKPGEPVSFAIPFSKIIEELGKRKK